ncbi:MAG: hypothetical protein IT480_06405 [Gammaproteobacteria bacterium]|nr:hypothetical protein [Gammaproteobacteria bacterium]
MLKSAIPWRLVAAGLALLAVFWLGWHQGGGRVQRRWDADRQAQAMALLEAKAHTAEVEKRSAQITQEVQDRYETLQNDYAALGSRLADSLRKYAALRARPVPGVPQPPGSPDAATPGPAGDGEGAGLAGLTADAFSACYADAAELSALQDWVRAQQAASITSN